MVSTKDKKKALIYWFVWFLLVFLGGYLIIIDYNIGHINVGMIIFGVGCFYWGYFNRVLLEYEKNEER